MWTRDTGVNSAGSSQFWLFGSSPLAPLDCIACSTSPGADSPFATEPLHIAFDGSPPSSVVSAEVCLTSSQTGCLGLSLLLEASAAS